MMEISGRKNLYCGKSVLLFFLSIFHLVLIVSTNNASANIKDEIKPCGGEYSGYEFTISSPNYPEKYGDNQNCIYTLRGSDLAKCDQEFNLQFLDFSLTPSENCAEDYVEIGDRSVFCGRVAGTRKFSTKNNRLLLRFHSDSRRVDKGFKIFVTTLPCFQEQIDEKNQGDTSEESGASSKNKRVTGRNLLFNGTIGARNDAETSNLLTERNLVPYPVYRPAFNFALEDNRKFIRGEIPSPPKVESLEETEDDVAPKFQGNHNYIPNSLELPVYPNKLFRESSVSTREEIVTPSTITGDENKSSKISSFLFVPPAKFTDQTHSPGRFLSPTASDDSPRVDTVTRPPTEILLPVKINKNFQERERSNNQVITGQRINERYVVPARAYGVPNEPYYPQNVASDQDVKTGEVLDNSRDIVDCQGKVNLEADLEVTGDLLGNNQFVNGNIGNTGISGGSYLPPTGISGGSYLPPTGISGGSYLPPTGISGGSYVPAPGIPGSSYFPPTGISSGSYVPTPGIPSGSYLPPTGISGGSYVPPTGTSGGSYVPTTGNPGGSYIPAVTYGVPGQTNPPGIITGNIDINLSTKYGPPANNYPNDVPLLPVRPNDWSPGPNGVPPPNVGNNFPNTVYPGIPNPGVNARFPECCSTVYSARRFLLSSPGFPSLSYNENPYECVYSIRPYSPDTCQMRFNFRFFNHGYDDEFCSQGYVEIDGRRICGCKKGLSVVSIITSSYPKVIGVKYTGSPRTKFNGFFIEVVQESCSNNYPNLVRNKKHIVNSTLEDFEPSAHPSPEIAVESRNRTNETLQRTKRHLGYSYSKPTFGFNEEPAGNVPTWNHGLTIKNQFSWDQKLASGNIFSPMFAACQALSFFDWAIAAKEAYLGNGRCVRSWGSPSPPGYYPGYPNGGDPGIVVPGFPGGPQFPSGRCEDVNVIEGLVSSPRYPTNYPNNVKQCFRFYKAPGYCQLEIDILDFDLEYSPGCSKDYVAFSGQNRRYCGRSLSGSRAFFDTRRGNIVDFYFVSDSFGTGRGISVGFVQIPCRGPNR